MQSSPLYATAISFLNANAHEQAAHDQLLLTRCISHVIDRHNVSRDTARDVAVQAAGELAARGRREYIDCSRTTSYTLFLVDEHGRRHALTIRDLVAQLNLAARPHA